ncbi:unnamed protein product [Rotaria socialis]|uniref:Uncharacterized protein n=1 Tax=Rotaria socialis TaxID=392032 RepID=A0A818VSP9_9BILA|nr:unnamed protein product [Rotaria socialis]CAF3660421.1 unnamed protein product [Rotaria socialis]CAF3681966.1 unnamed protein product [Rotaria socialis]CAF3715269.1 unnamed protein product [Rotaria socialis]CAF4543347.1 unnamed protein product [Rotaria socialis]
MTCWFVFPSSLTGNSRRVELAGIDLWLFSRTDQVFVYPSQLDIDRFKNALSRTLSVWPLIAGHLLLLDDGHYVIEMSDNPIPVTYAECSELAAWPFDFNIVSELHKNLLASFIDEVQVIKLFSSSLHEPLVRLKLTRLVQSGEWILGASWAHILGDAASFLNFLNSISRFYQNLESIGTLPVFERRLWREDEADKSLLPIMKHLSHAGPLQEMLQLFCSWQETHDQLTLRFSGDQLAKLRELAGGNNVTIQDSLSAYLILTLNTHCYVNDHQHRIQRANTVVNFRGVSDSIAPIGHVSNAIVMMLSDDFYDPLSLSSIAKTIRHSIIRVRDSKFLEPWLATADGLMRKIARENLLANWGQFPNEIIINSNFRYDWVSLVDFGYTDKCRLYTTWTGPLYFRVFRLNPVYDGTQWLPRDQDGAEVAFLIEKDIKQIFIRAYQKDIEENFANVK